MRFAATNVEEEVTVCYDVELEDGTPAVFQIKCTSEGIIEDVLIAGENPECPEVFATASAMAQERVDALIYAIGKVGRDKNK